MKTEKLWVKGVNITVSPEAHQKMLTHLSDLRLRTGVKKSLRELIDEAVPLIIAE